MNDDTEVEWSVLPEEIWSAIGNLLDRRLDVLRFRSVCKLWRSLIPPFPDSPPPLLLRLTVPIQPVIRAGGLLHRSTDAFLSQTTVFRIVRPFEDLSSSSSSRKGWLVKVEETDEGKFRILDPITSRSIEEIPDMVSNSYRLLEFRMIELIKTYALRYTRQSTSVAGVNKSMLVPNSEESAVFVIYDYGKLGFARNEEKEIFPIDDRILDYNDLIVYMGQPYVVDRWGTVSWIDSSFRLVQFSPPLSGFGGRKHMVVSGGDLYVVDRYIENEEDYMQLEISARQFSIFHCYPMRRRAMDYCRPKSVDFKVFKLDQDWGTWVEVKNLGDQAFVLSCDFSLSVSAQDFAGFKPNCIYFTEQFDLNCALRGARNNGGCVFNLEDKSIEKLENLPGYSQMFWPWLCTNS